MINGLEGIPGSGKSYEAAVYHVLPALQAGRKVITNLPLLPEMYAAINPDYLHLIELRTRVQPIRGTWDATRADAFELHEDGTVQAPDTDVMLFGHVWDFYSTWKHPDTGAGPLFIIDECHVAFPKLQCNKQVIEWFKLHRHFNVDVLLATQNFRDVNESIRNLIAILVKVRKADILGKADHYIRKVHGGYRGGLVSQEERKYKKQMFNLYRSHTQGNSVGESKATDVSPFIVKFNRFKWLWIAGTVVYSIWAFWPESKKPAKVATKQPPPALAAAPATVSNPFPQGTPQAKPQQPSTDPQQPQDPQEDEDPEPFVGKLVHLTGMLEGKRGVLYTFAVSMNGQRISTTTSDELAQMGYRWKAYTACAGVLRWGTKAHAITCDAPQLARGTEDKPVVLAVPAGTAAPVASSRDKS